MKYKAYVQVLKKVLKKGFLTRKKKQRVKCHVQEGRLVEV